MRRWPTCRIWCGAADGQVLGAGKLDELQLGFGALNRLYETEDDWICVVAITDAHLDALGKATETEADISES